MSATVKEKDGLYSLPETALPGVGALPSSPGPGPGSPGLLIPTPCLPKQAFFRGQPFNLAAPPCQSGAECLWWHLHTQFNKWLLETVFADEISAGRPPVESQK